MIRRIVVTSRSPGRPSPGWRLTRCWSRPWVPSRLRATLPIPALKTGWPWYVWPWPQSPGSRRATSTPLCPAGNPTTPFDTLQRLRSQLQPTDVLFCLLGADSFLTLRRWHQCAELLLFCDFIVAGRPGFSLEQINAALPKGVVNTGEHREAAFTRFTLVRALRPELRTVSVARSGPGHLRDRDSRRSGRRRGAANRARSRGCGIHSLPRSLPVP